MSYGYLISCIVSDQWIDCLVDNDSGLIQDVNIFPKTIIYGLSDNVDNLKIRGAYQNDINQESYFRGFNVFNVSEMANSLALLEKIIVDRYNNVDFDLILEHAPTIPTLSGDVSLDFLK